MFRTVAHYLSLPLFIFFCIYGLAAKDFYTRGESREANVISSIVEDGQWILPQGYSGVIPSKPPVMHWLSALAVEFIPGHAELTIRAPSFLLGVVLLGFLYFVIKKREDTSEVALLTVFILVSTPEWFRAMLAARVDMTLAVSLSFATYLGFLSLEKRRWSIAILSGLCLAVATLTKGPVALVLWGTPLGAFLLLRHRNRLGTGLLLLLVAFFLGAVLGFSWYYAAYLKSPHEFLNKIYYENVARFLSEQEDGPHKKSIVSFLVLCFLGFFPWSILLLKKLVQSLGWLRRGSIKFSTLSDFKLFLLLQIASTIFFFSIPDGKRSVYILPIYPAVSYFLALWLHPVSKNVLRVAEGVLAALAIAWVLVILYLQFIPCTTLQCTTLQCTTLQCTTLATYARAFNQSSTFALGLGVLIPLIGSIVATTYADTLRKTAVLTITILLTLHASWFVLFSNAVSPRDFLKTLPPSVLEQPLYSLGNEFYSVAFYLDKHVQRLETVPVGERGSHHGFVFFYQEHESELRTLYPALSIVAISEYGVVKDDSRLFVGRF